MKSLVQLFSGNSSIAASFTARFFTALLFACLLNIVTTVNSANAVNTVNSAHADSARASWQVEQFTLTSKLLKNNKVELNTEREVWVWLPPSYHTSTKRYPVIHYVHNYGWSAQQMHEVEHIHQAFERALERRQTQEFIFVIGDYRATQTPGTFCGNNLVVGRWWDHVVDELVPAVDQRYRTLPTAEARGLSGDFIGGYCAIRIAMERPGIFSSVYALHPVGTSSGGGEGVMRTVADWQQINSATSFDELESASGITRAFVMMAQSHAPNPRNPPFYADFMMDLNGEALEVNHQVVTDLRNNFSLQNRVQHSVVALKGLKGFMFDWGRYDPNAGHVRGNRRFANELEEYAIPHFAEEHRGNAWDQKWIPYGRVEDRMLPFFTRFLSAPE